MAKEGWPSVRRKKWHLHEGYEQPSFGYPWVLSWPCPCMHPAFRIRSMDVQPVQSLGLCPRKVLCLVKGSDITFLKFFMIFLTRGLAFSFAQIILLILPVLHLYLYSCCSLHRKSFICPFLPVRTWPLFQGPAQMLSSLGQPPQAWSRLSSGLPKHFALLLF